MVSFDNDQSFLKPQVGNDKLMRDPCIISDASGTFHMVWTISWQEKGIGYANIGQQRKTYLLGDLSYNVLHYVHIA